MQKRSLRLLLFGGKGGVGKTTCAAAAALHLAEGSPGIFFLLVSTDPAHSLADSLAGSLPPSNLKILELDARKCLAAFKEKHSEKLREIASRGTFLDDEDIQQFMDLSLPGLDELMAFLEISRWVKERRYDCIVVDTAPTGHTLQLLAMPDLIREWLAALDVMLAKRRYMAKLYSGVYRRDDLDRFLEELARSVGQMKDLLRNPERCCFVPVMLAEAMSLSETADLLGELERQEIPVGGIVVNRLYPDNTCRVCAGERARQERELRQAFREFLRYPLWGAPLYPEEVRGLQALEAFWERVRPLESRVKSQESRVESQESRVERQEPWITVRGSVELPSPETRLLLFAGKGGVGKTTLACATALRLAEEAGGREVFLFSTDPAHSLADCMDRPIGPRPTRLAHGLTAMEIDAQAEFRTLKTQYMEEVGQFWGSFLPNLDLTFDREVMERLMDLSPPGLAEVMALNRAMAFLEQDHYDLFVLDSAPTGHLIRLLELPEIMDGWLKVFFGVFLKYRQVFRLPKLSQRLVQMSKDLKRLRALLCDPARTALYAVTIPAEMAFQETRDLLDACKWMGVHVPALFVNLVTLMGDCRLCAALYQRESKLLWKLKEAFPNKQQVLIYRQVEPRGLDGLSRLGARLYHPESVAEGVLHA